MPESKSGALPLGDSPAEICIVRYREFPNTAALESFFSSIHANAASGCRASVRATHRPSCFGTSVNAAVASRSVGKGAKTHAPDPVMRACGDARDNASIVAATAGNAMP
jgi:hypothetical protein